MLPLESDMVIIGGGIIGTAIARELSKYQLNVVLLEKEPDIGVGATKANSGILHAGFDALPGSLKASLNVRGNSLYHRLEHELGLEIKWTGSLVVAKTPEEMSILQDLLVRGQTNGVTGLKILTKDEVIAREPNIVPDVLGALWSPSAGIILPFGAALAFAQNAALNGVKIITDCPVEGIYTDNGRVTGVKTPVGSIKTDYIINAAGAYSDEISRLAGDDSFNIKVRKGEYILFDKHISHLVKNVLFPAPSKISKGILVSPTVHGNIFIGPNAAEVEDKNDLGTTAEGLAEIIDGGRRLVPALSLSAAITQFSGLRAAASGGDFIIRQSFVKGLIHAAGIQSPGLTSAPAIAQMIIDIIKDSGLTLVPKIEFNPLNSSKVVFRELSDKAKSELIKKDPRYGSVICRCETVTEGEIVDAIHALCGAKTIDAIKRRTRAGMGRCQGGFCGPRVTAILARELNISITEVRKEKSNSYLFFSKKRYDCEVTGNDQPHKL